MKPASHPLLKEREEYLHLLSPEEWILIFLGAHVSQGNLKEVEKDWRHLPEDLNEAALEVILQTHLFAGYPRAINALIAVHRVDPNLKISTLADSLPPEQWQSSGESLCNLIYGENYPALRRRMNRLHPALDTWMVEMGYGRVLSRPGLSPLMRELCAVAVLAGQNVEAQLLSHLKGSLHVGASKELLRGVLNCTAELYGPSEQAYVDAVWKRLTSGAVG